MHWSFFIANLLLFIVRPQSRKVTCDIKATKKSGNSADVVLRSERALDSYSFLSRFDEFFDVYQGRLNIPQSQVYSELPNSVNTF